MGPIAAVILIVGAGGGFKQTLIGSGVGGAVAKWATGANISVLVLGYLIAVAIRLATGSLDSQIATLEPPGPDENTIVVDVGRTLRRKPPGWSADSVSSPHQAPRPLAIPTQAAPQPKSQAMSKLIRPIVRGIQMPFRARDSGVGPALEQ